jgi:hypothetical protein
MPILFVLILEFGLECSGVSSACPYSRLYREEIGETLNDGTEPMSK